MSAVRFNPANVQSAETSKAEPAQRVRVAFVVHGLQTGGIERSITRLVNGLDRNRFEPSIICLDKSGPAAEWIDASDVPVLEVNKRSGNDWRAVSRLVEMLKELQIDIVHSHNWGTLMETVLARRRAGTAVHVHAERGTVLGTVESRGLRHRLRAMAMHWALKRVDVVVSNAAATARRVEQKCGYPASTIQLVANGVEPPPVEDAALARSSIRRKLGIDPDAFVVGSVGRLHPVKGFDLAIEAVAGLIGEGRNAHLLLVGDGPEFARLQETSEKLGVANRVHLVGEQTAIGEWLAAMDVFVNTSHSEGMSQSLVEAMAAGLPAVVTDVGDNAIVLGDGEHSCGLIVPPASVQILTEALCTLACGEEVCAYYGRQARNRHAEEFAYDRMIRRFESLYMGQLMTAERANATSLSAIKQPHDFPYCETDGTALEKQ